MERNRQIILMAATWLWFSMAAYFCITMLAPGKKPNEDVERIEQKIDAIHRVVVGSKP